MATSEHTTAPAEDSITTARVKSMLRELDIETTDACVAATTVTVCIQAYTGHTVPIGENGAEHIVLSDDQRDVLTHHAHTAERSIRRVATAVEEVVAAADHQPGATMLAFDPILRHIENYRECRQRMESPDMSDEAAMLLHAEAIAPFAGTTPPVVKTTRGAAEALRLLKSFHDIDAVDANLVDGVIAFLDARA